MTETSVRRPAIANLRGALASIAGAPEAYVNQFGARMPSIKGQRMQRALAIYAELEAEREAIVTRLLTGYDWCEGHVGDTRFAAGETHWLGLLDEYEQIEDALADFRRRFPQEITA